PRSPASRAQPQIVPGDVILKINSQPITSVAEFNRKINALKSGDTALILIQRKDRTLISELTVD
ncbi:MAG TPA: PDZ domain-containing protein, partial [Armatimonadota bacterium]|nr:PDZ domain-containing protein [Armatimonadota bacterium]